ncbi:hypothetical protein DFH07DRAFT_787733 [Mycena maculata]|uniref:Uncharacterized protein n=1 Tax=Mycena maculata TaxID=230809 RepID=A0AAD7P129_9AGAR|nr:hypothetical protein DFH07DRAFT_787733 [Mycena maculata]
MSKVFKDDLNKMEGAAWPSEPTGQNGDGEKMPHSSLTHSHESLGSITENGRRSSSTSGQSLFTGDDPSTSTPSEAGTKGKLPPRANRHLGENIPPSPTKRRQSLDPSSRATSTSPGDLKRSKSLWVQQHQRQAVLDDAAGEFQERYAQNFGTGAMSERQRALNVKRARKMAQVFGQEPPSELIHIHDERESDHFRDSTATLSTYLSVTPPLRDRANSTSSSGTVPNEVEVDEDMPPTPPPFSTAHVIDDAVLESPPTNNFQDRRRRAAKLSRFFGVGFRDLSLPPEAMPLPSPQVEVDVKVGGRRFWTFNDRSKDNMEEAMVQLRGLKAT